MASAKKKLDEYHLKVLRHYVSFPANKECFDCHQRGPTYINVTIGSYVCTKCSGLLRGLTPPHRVKSISMATFTPEEIDFVKARGNDYCRRTWLGLLDTEQPTKDENQIKDFMVAKYERKRYFLDPAIASTLSKTVNGNLESPKKPSAPSEQTHPVRALPAPATVHPHPTTLVFKPPSSQTVNNSNMFTPDTFADFNSLSIPPPCDPFNSSQSAAAPAPSASSQPSFADFDNNPVFSNSSSTGVPGVGEAGTVPGEDRYAALKDLDSLMKSQQQQQQQQQHKAPEPVKEWNPGVNGITNNNMWSSPALFPSATSDAKEISATSNPFKGNGSWNNVNSGSANPFRNPRPMPTTDPVWPHVTNGQIPNGFPTSQSLNFAAPKVPWNSEAMSNPFALGSSPQSTGHHSSNPFL